MVFKKTSFPAEPPAGWKIKFPVAYVSMQGQYYLTTFAVIAVRVGG